MMKAKAPYIFLRWFNDEDLGRCIGLRVGPCMLVSSWNQHFGFDVTFKAGSHVWSVRF